MTLVPQDSGARNLHLAVEPAGNSRRRSPHRGRRRRRDWGWLLIGNLVIQTYTLPASGVVVTATLRDAPVIGTTVAFISEPIVVRSTVDVPSLSPRRTVHITPPDPPFTREQLAQRMGRSHPSERSWLKRIDRAASNFFLVLFAAALAWCALWVCYALAWNALRLLPDQGEGVRTKTGAVVSSAQRLLARILERAPGMPSIPAPAWGAAAGRLADASSHSKSMVAGWRSSFHQWSEQRHARSAQRRAERQALAIERERRRQAEAQLEAQQRAEAAERARSEAERLRQQAADQIEAARRAEEEKRAWAEEQKRQEERQRQEREWQRQEQERQQEEARRNEALQREQQAREKKLADLILKYEPFPHYSDPQWVESYARKNSGELLSKRDEIVWEFRQLHDSREFIDLLNSRSPDTFVRATWRIRALAFAERTAVDDSKKSPPSSAVERQDAKDAEHLALAEARLKRLLSIPEILDKYPSLPSDERGTAQAMLRDALEQD